MPSLRSNQVTNDQPPGDDGVVRPFAPPARRPGRGQGQQEAAHVRDNQALELRMAGASYQQVGDALGINKGEAHHAVHRALARDDERTQPLRDEYRNLQLARTERLIRTHWTHAIEGDLDHSKHVLTLMERQARLLGLDAPKQVTISGGILQAADDAMLRLREVVLGEVIEAAADDSEHG